MMKKGPNKKNKFFLFLIPFELYKGLNKGQGLADCLSRCLSPPGLFHEVLYSYINILCNYFNTWRNKFFFFIFMELTIYEARKTHCFQNNIQTIIFGNRLTFASGQLVDLTQTHMENEKLLKDLNNFLDAFLEFFRLLHMLLCNYSD